MNVEQNCITWKMEYNLNVEDIDFQHHFFANLINRLSEELKVSNHAEYQSRLISELNAYAVFHFISEENMMLRASYPQLEAHQKHHFDLLQRLSVEGNTFKLNPSKEEAERIINFLVEWFLNHTIQEDRLFADYLHNSNRE